MPTPFPASRSPLIAGNWKMFHGGRSALALASKIAAASRGVSGVDVLVAPPFTALAAVSQELDGTGIDVAAQNLHPANEGAFTGEVSGPMLVDAGCRWVIIGHSERRQLFGETDDGVAKKVAAAMAAKLRPIVCVGETLEEREANRTLEVVFRQLDAFAAELSRQPGFGVIAYEPVWAIGTGRVAGPEQAEEVHAKLRKRLTPALASATRILYGGSVKPENAAGLLTCDNVDGALVGGASLDADSFAAIVRAAVPPSFHP